MKKKLMALFAFVLIVAGVCFLNIEGSMVQAADIIGEYTDENGGDFKSVQYSEISEFRGKTYSAPTPEGYEEHLFAGWYSEQECVNALPSSTKSGEAWAKFVPAGVLSVKSQISEPNAETGSYNMRIISTLDTLKYGAVGFKVEYNNNGKIIDIPIKEVYTRIKATAESGVDYNFSPKVVDTKSEYFMTATLLNINSEKTGNIFRVVPYWKTLDGTMVNGVNRYVAVDDGITSNDAMSFTVKADAIDFTKLAVSTASDTSIDTNDITHRHVDTTDNYVTVVVKGQGKTSLSSATKYVITDGNNSVDVVYRNLDTTHIKSGSTSVNADTSWYTVYNGLDSTTDEYVIATTADFYGFESYSNKDNTFEKQTVYLVADIELNKGQLATSWTRESGPTYKWEQIGSNGVKFKGAFDGQMHTISGIYVSGGDYVGLFQYVRNKDTVVKNFTLKNSYFYGDKYVGSVAGKGAGTFDSIYSTAIVESGTGGFTGGLIGQLLSQDAASEGTNSISSINNCWFEGTVLSYGTYVGGIVGNFQQGTLNITNVLNTGNVTCNYSTNATSNTHVYTAGICGGAEYTAATLNITDSMNQGDVKAYYYDSENEKTYENSYLLTAAISVGKNGTATLTNVFDASGYLELARKGNKVLNRISEWSGSSEDIEGYNGYNVVTNTNTKLDFYTLYNPKGEWILRENDIPALKSFVNDGIDVAWYYDNNDVEPYTISTEEELYGLAALSKTDDFEGEIIKLTSDIKLNNGIASEWAEHPEKAGRNWTIIGRSSSTPFKGTFDGQGHTISGLYMTTETANAGLFGYIEGATIQNVRIEESYFESLIGSNTNANMGCIAGNGHGTLRNIYSNAIVFTNGKRVGGLMGYTGTSDGSQGVDMISCWFDGELTVLQTNNAAVQCGGLVGYGRTVTMDTCLNTGSIKLNRLATVKIATVDAGLGGFVGALGANVPSTGTIAKIIIRNCLNASTMELKWYKNESLEEEPTEFKNYGTMMYGSPAADVFSASNTYSVAAIKIDLSDFNKEITTSYDENYTTKSVDIAGVDNQYAGSASELYSDLARNNTQLPFTIQERSDLNGTDTNETALWTTREGDLPIPGASVTPVVADTGWYNANDEIVTYHISTAEELYGFAQLVNGGTTFTGETIYLDNDIEINTVVKSDTEDTIEEWTAGNTGSVRLWTPIGNSASVNFAGTFDGQGNSISGLFMTTTSENAGLFGYINNATIQNVRIDDSYFESLIGSNQNANMGCVAGNGYGTLRNIYSNAVVYTNGKRVGGLMGYAGTTTEGQTVNIISCWFDGKVVISQSNDAVVQCGGLVGYGRRVTMDTCLNTGTITLNHKSSSTAYTQSSLNIGGLIGALNNNASQAGVVLRHCLNASSVELIWQKNDALDDESPERFINYGAVLGNYYETTFSAKNVYSVGTIKIDMSDFDKSDIISYAVYHTSSDQTLSNVDSQYAGVTGGLYGDLAKGKLPFTLEERLALNSSDTNTNETAIWMIREGNLPIPGTSVAPVVADVSWHSDDKKDENGAYHIATVEELYGFATLVNEGTTFSGEKIFLDEDIEINTVVKSDTEDTIEDWMAGNVGSVKVWTPIGTSEKAFDGTFDGQEHTISGMYFAEDNKKHIGLFGHTQDATIQNVAVVDSYFETSHNSVTTVDIGSVVGYAYGSLNLYNVYSNSTINVSNAQRVGGLVGGTNTSDANKSSTEVELQNCWYDGLVKNQCASGQMLTGGFIGFAVKGNKVTINSSLYSGEIIGVYSGTDNLRIGGFVGACNSDTYLTNFVIKDSLSAGKINAIPVEGGTIKQVGSVVGNVASSTNRSITTVYTTLESYSKAIGNGAPATRNIISIEEESSWGVAPCSFQGLNDNSIWVPREGKTPGLKSFATSDYETYIVADRSWADDVDGGTEGNPYIIKDAADLLGLSMLSLEGNKFDGKTIQVEEGVTEIDLNPSWEAGSGVANVFWNPVGRDSNTSFKGIFDGNGATIKGIYNNSNNTTYVGLFGYVHKNATIRDIYLKNSEFVQNTGKGASVGSIAAELCGSVDTVYSDAMINSESQYSGGLFARVNGGAIELNTDEATGITTYNRGIVSIQNAWYDGNINISTNMADRYTGGIGAVVVQGTVDMKNILFTGRIDAVRSSSAAYAGGIVGATMAQTIESETNKYQDDDYTTIKLDSCISAGVVNQEGSQRGSIVGRLLSKINKTETEGIITKAYPANTYLKIANVFASSECNAYAYHKNSESVDVNNLETNEVTKVTANGIITDATGTTGAAIVQSQYNSDQLIGYCTEYDYGDTTYSLSANLDFSETGWTMRNDGCPIPTAFSSVVDEASLVSDTSTLTSTLGLDYWGAEKSLLNAVNSGKGNYLLNYTVSAEKTYDGFIASLADKGFAEAYATNANTSMALDGVYNSTYVNGNWVLNITYVENKGTVDVVINTYGADSLSPNLLGVPEEQTGGEDAVKLSMLSLSDSGVMGEYGNSFVFRLPNGHFIISDGGKSTDAVELIDYLKTLAGTSVNEEGQEVQNPVCIDAWVISHFHTDHCGALMNMYESSMADYRQDVYVKAVYFNEPNNYATLFEENQYENASKALGGAMMFKQAPGSDAKPYVYRMHTGERYYFNGVTMDVVLTQEQLDPHYDAGVRTSKEAYRYYGDWDGFNATSTTCVFTVTDTQDKIYMGGDSNRANMNYIMQAYDNEDAYMYVANETNTWGSDQYERWTEKIEGTINKTSSSTLSDISVFVALHHGKNTSNGFTQYLFGDTDATDDSLDIVLFPYHQMYSATYEASKTVDGTLYKNRYWMEDDSSVFEYLIEKYNQNLYASANDKYYTYGYEDCTGATADSPHGTVELTFTSNGIIPNVLE